MRREDEIDLLKRRVYLGLSLAGAVALVVGFVVLPHPTRENYLLLVYAGLLLAVAAMVLLGAPTRRVGELGLGVSALFFLTIAWLNLFSISHGAGVWPPLLWAGLVYLLAFVLLPPRQAYVFAGRYYLVLLLGGVAALGLGAKNGRFGAEQAGDALQILLSNLGYLALSWVLVAFGMRAEADRAHARQMQQLADTDALTGALSRRRFLQDAEEALASGRPGSLILFDLDDFKRINDTHGHPAGDRVLIRSVQRVLRNLRKGDLLGRLGGEEFAVLFPGLKLEDALQMAERLRRALEAPSSDLPATTASFGVVEFTEQDSIRTLLACADRALYQSKRTGKNRVAAARN